MPSISSLSKVPIKCTQCLDNLCKSTLVSQRWNEKKTADVSVNCIHFTLEVSSHKLSWISIRTKFHFFKIATRPIERQTLQQNANGVRIQSLVSIATWWCFLLLLYMLNLIAVASANSSNSIIINTIRLNYSIVHALYILHLFIPKWSWHFSSNFTILLEDQQKVNNM